MRGPLELIDEKGVLWGIATFNQRRGGERTDFVAHLLTFH